MPPNSPARTLTTIRQALLAGAALFLGASLFPGEDPPPAPPDGGGEGHLPAAPAAAPEEEARPEDGNAVPSGEGKAGEEAADSSSPSATAGGAPQEAEETGPAPGPAPEAPAAPAPAVPPRASPPVFASRDVELRFRVEERGAAEIVGYRVHYTLDGGRSWQSQDVAGAASPVVFRAPRDGRYGFLLSAVDAAGGQGPDPAAGTPPALWAIVDTVPPAIKVLRPDRIDVVPPDGRVEIEWEVRDEDLGPAPVEMAASQDGGPWETIWTDAPPRGKRAWNVPLLPGEVKLRFRARDLAGNSSEESPPVVIRVAPGEGTVSRWVAVSPRSRSRRVQVYYRLAREAAAGLEPLPPDEVRKVEVYSRLEGGLAWTSGGLDPDRRSPLTFEAPSDGRFELLVVALDRGGRPVPAGLALDPQGRPDANAPPHARVLVDTLEPRVTIEAPLDGASVVSGSPSTVLYSVEEENPRRGSTTIWSSLDGGATWTVLAEGLDSTPVEGRLSRGELPLQLPRIESEKFLLKVQCADAAGNVGEASTDPRKPIDLRDPRENLARKAEDLYRRGVVQIRSSDPVERGLAIESFRRALIYRPDHAPAHHDLACALESSTVSSGASAGDEALRHFRKAHSLAADDPRIAFGLVGALIARSAGTKGDGSRALLEEAEAVFRKVSWTRIVEIAGEDREESQRLRRQYREWKEQYFNRVPR